MDFGSSASDGGASWDGSGCVDEDGDGFGVGCPAGPDCDDGARGIRGPCRDNGCPQGWVLVEGGVFSMGCSEDDLCWRGESAESPRHEVTLRAFCVERFEVPLESYRSCRNDGVCTGEPLSNQNDVFCNWSPTPGENELHPVNCITWTDARSYCRDWMGGDLLSEAEWELTARGTQAFVYPWGDTPEPSCDRCNYDVNGGDLSDTKGCGEVSEGPATWRAHDDNNGELGASPYGARDMAGNVHEWVLDCFDPFFYSTCSGGCEDPVNLCGDGAQRVIRGGAFSTINSNYLRAVWRGSLFPDEASSAVGFRCRHPVQ